MNPATGTKLVAALAVIASLIVAVTAGMTSRAADGATTSAADQIRAAEHERLRAEVDADTEKAGRLLAPGFQQINVAGAVGSRADYLATIGGGVDFVTLTPVSSIKVRVYGNAAVARYQAAFDVIERPDHVKHRGWTTDLFERRQGKWLLVWSQTTAVPNDPDLYDPVPQAACVADAARPEEAAG